MYNSRPRVQRFTSEIDVPQNYRGNAFRDLPPDEPEIVPPPAAAVEKEAVEEPAVTVSRMCEEEEVTTKKKAFGFNVGRFYSGGIGYEELLILGLILLVAQNEGNEDTLLLLALLLFVG